jgi:hypothetical protein
MGHGEKQIGRFSSTITLIIAIIMGFNSIQAVMIALSTTKFNRERHANHGA